ncbi:uncharacterized protein BX663DRAFT_521743 [Cokeromyces recurvatus]|uniref:uncharacterized protein n=1 Tax=Cokeromyces recurvatus TaxID=90255 RepID=UPI00221FF579|nr:uncharacterized protein BX663DRAFT_521743 [Cokeromyces recurvatus]KAI7899190.1 hypothetical protein BX663DRAFT_521743 [Cokeromyces recurvatus]
MDRVSEAAAHDLAEVRKLVEGMNALVNSQQKIESEKQQKLLKQKQKAQQKQRARRESLTPQHVVSPECKNELQQHDPIIQPSSQDMSSNDHSPQSSGQQKQIANDQPTMQLPMTNGVIIEVTHLGFTRTLYFQLSLETTIEPLIAWLRLSFWDNSISGMVLQYKGFDGLWKCLLNRDDSLKRILKQSLKNNVILQMRVPREQDLLSSGYTDKRLLVLTSKMINNNSIHSSIAINKEEGK